MRKSMMLGAVTLGAIALSWVGARDASACGGCFGPPPPPTENPTVVTDHRMILTISSQQTTLYDQIRYSGSPSEFAWVLPISGQVQVGLSADVVFATLDAVTATSIISPPQNCPARPTCNQGGANTFGNAAPSAAGGADQNGGVTVTKQEVVGPYETVQLHSTDPNALNTWLTQHGYQVSSDVQPVIAAYVAGHFDFLAMKLVPGAGVAAMRPVRVTSGGAAPLLPLRMVAAGTGSTVGVTLWIIGEGRYEPMNFPFFHIETNDVAWDWTKQESNYTQLRADNEQKLGGAGWEIESSLATNPAQIENYVRYGVPNQRGGPGGVRNTGNAADDYLPIPASGSTPAESAEQVREDDLNTLFAGIDPSSARVTRIRSDLAHAALGNDLLLQASQDQSQLSNIRQLTKELNEPLCPVYDSNCQQVGTAPRSVALNGQHNFACSTAAAPGPFTDPTTLGSVACLLGLAFIGARKRHVR